MSNTDFALAVEDLTVSFDGFTVTAPNGAKAFPSKRPWMISH